jgi:CRP/FNR family cyclic AMP-dependent transcriptional regulator
MENMEKILIATPIFKDLDPKHIKILAEHATHITFKSKEFIRRRDEYSDSFYLITHGKVALELYSARRGPLIVHTVGEGQILGSSWLIPPYRWRLDAHAMELTRAIAFDGKTLREMCEKDHDFGYSLLKIFAEIAYERLEAARYQLLDIYGDHT